MTEATDDVDNPIPTGLPALDYDKIKNEVDGADAPALSPEARAAHPMAQEEYTFTISIVDGAGRKIEGEFKNKILTDDERVKIGIIASRIVRNMPWQLLDSETQSMALIAAHLSISIVSRPKWYQPGSIKNSRLQPKIYEEVAKHEAFFRGSDGA